MTTTFRARRSSAGITALCLSMAACATDGPKTAIPDEPPLPPRDLALSPIATASLWNQEPQSLFGNRRARKVGDILTVIVQVDENAQMQNTLQSTRVAEDEVIVDGMFGLPQWASNVLPGGATLSPAVDVSRNTINNGNGRLLRQEQITLRLAAEVVEERPNGHLVIAGTQRIRVNNETRDLRLSGIVRPEDITRENTISHDKVAAADILYAGQGHLAVGASRRRGARFLDFLIPF